MAGVHSHTTASSDFGGYDHRIFRPSTRNASETGHEEEEEQKTTSAGVCDPGGVFDGMAINVTIDFLTRLATHWMYYSLGCKELVMVYECITICA
uniref:Uncharacterized protein n=1 Tax=Peronospora matthiolae TaxID=2874970 RepID=A0AAV1UN41_9STRA